MLFSMALDRKALDLCVDEFSQELSALSLRIHAHPELCFEERQAAAWLAECLERQLGIRVERGVGGLETAFRARVGAGSPKIAILGEPAPTRARKAVSSPPTPRSTRMPS